MGRTWLWLVGLARDLDGAGEGKQLEPGQGITGGLHVGHAAFGQRPKGPQRRRGVAGVHRLSRGTSEMELGRRVVAVTAWTGSPLRRDHPLLLEVADHPRRESHRLAGGSDARQLLGSVIDR
jgi:hypothetical protein